ncbi:MAG: tetratricopeptide repeat protein [Steroidobacteraceae bacterium]
MNAHSSTARAALAATLACLPVLLLDPLATVAAAELGIGGSRSVYGTNPYLSDGATALMLGNYQRGVELTREGLKDILTTEERVTLLSNLCAGYVGLKEYDTAIVYCNRSLDLDPSNWRALQNRAAAYAGLNQITKALSDVEQGLELNPDSDDLKLTLSIIREKARRELKPAGNQAN